ncbi:MAG: polysaccharide pyruvyl transferase family protein [Bacteroidales bacterium]|nr:polysaccharide pyruvyl transferase family protein [Bacteroidales bacterium]
MENILLLDPAIGSKNLGDHIISECVHKELSFVFQGRYLLELPTQVSSFHWYQVLRNSLALKDYSQCRLKFVGGSNVMVKDLLTHYPQWNINLFNYKPFKGTILVGVGAGRGSRSNAYTRHIYRKMLSSEYFHSVRDERSKEYVECLGLKAINTGCVTMWALTPEHCAQIPSKKSDEVVFTLTATGGAKDKRDQIIIDTLLNNYSKVFYWPQGYHDEDYLHLFDNTGGITVLEPTKEAYDRLLTEHNADYVGTRLHGGVYAMRHKRRAIIIAIDERARSINEGNHLNCVDKENLEALEPMVQGEFKTEIKMDFDAIARWKNQFITKEK